MTWIGLPGSGLLAVARTGARSAQPWGWTLLGAIAALGPALWMWGFTVDDALISVRYARHLGAGLGWRFNAAGSVTDGVTPLPWPFLLWVLACAGHAGALTVLARAKLLGLVAWAFAGAGLGRTIGRTTGNPWQRAGVLAVLSLSVPAAAHAVTGMETAVATLLATSASLASRRPLVGAVLAGLAAAFRPELVLWALALSALRAILRRSSLVLGVGACFWSLAPFLACAALREIVWGRAVPLAVLAKPSDLAHGLAYVGAGCVVTLVPVLAAAPLSLRKSPEGAAIAIAGVVHLLAVALVGGDWMPYSRLLVPVLPSLAMAGALAGERRSRFASPARVATGLAVGALLLPGAREGRAVGADRARLVAEAAPVLAGFRRVACLDVGWVSAATEADIIDLGGVTDPEIACLPGGLTSKHVTGMMLLTRDPDALLLYAPDGLPGGDLDQWARATYPRLVERRLALDDVIADRFAPAAWLPLGRGTAGYVVLRIR